MQVKGAAIGGLVPTRGSVPLHLLDTMVCLEMWQALLVWQVDVRNPMPTCKECLFVGRTVWLLDRFL